MSITCLRSGIPVFFLRKSGFTIIELLVVLSIIGIICSITFFFFISYFNKVKIQSAVADLNTIEKSIAFFESEHGRLPDSLGELNLDNMTDPWGNPYVYLRIKGNNSPGINGKIRKDKNLHPVNTDYDIYSKGADGSTAAQFSAKKARDDIVRANNGRYFGLAENHIPL